MSKHKHEFIAYALVSIFLSSGCISAPVDETYISSRSTAVPFSAYIPSELGSHDDEAISEYEFYLKVHHPNNIDFVTIEGPTSPSVSKTAHGNYDWHTLSFGSVVIPNWAWADEGSRWHASLSIVEATDSVAPLMALESHERNCYVDEIGNGEHYITAGANCGADLVVDLYVNK